MDCGTSTRAAFVDLISSSLDHFLKFEDLVLKRDADAVHKLRVSVRKLRSLFSTFRPALPVDDFITAIRSELRWLQQILGRCRDWDVFIIRTAKPLLAKSYSSDMVQLVHVSTEQRNAAYDILTKAVSSKRYIELIESLRRIDSLHGTSVWLNRPIYRYAKRAIKKQTKKLVTEHSLEDIMRLNVHQGDREDAARQEIAIHNLRKKIKKLRYAIEGFAPLFKKERNSDWLDSVIALQDVLGNTSDVQTAYVLLDSFPHAALSNASRYLVTGWMLAKTHEDDELRKLWSDFVQLPPIWK